MKDKVMASTNQSEKAYSLSALAKKWSISSRTLARMVHEKQLRAFLLSGQYRVFESDAQEYLRRREGIKSQAKGRGGVKV